MSDASWGTNYPVRLLKREFLLGSGRKKSTKCFTFDFKALYDSLDPEFDTRDVVVVRTKGLGDGPPGKNGKSAAEQGNVHLLENV